MAAQKWTVQAYDKLVESTKDVVIKKVTERKKQERRIPPNRYGSLSDTEQRDGEHAWNTFNSDVLSATKNGDTLLVVRKKMKQIRDSYWSPEFFLKSSASTSMVSDIRVAFHAKLGNAPKPSLKELSDLESRLAEAYSLKANKCQVCHTCSKSQYGDQCDKCFVTQRISSLEARMKTKKIAPQTETLKQALHADLLKKWQTVGGPKCFYTGLPLTQEDTDLDHVRPFSRNAALSFEKRNLVWTLASINKMKGDMDPEEFVALLGKVKESTSIISTDAIRRQIQA